MAAISKDVKALAQQPWFPELMRELGYEPKRKTGRWMQDEDDNSIKCNQCGCTMWANDLIDGDAFYCPNCGARMDGERDG